MNLSNLTARAHGRYQRTAARFFFRRPFVINSEVPLISFTFDDFPRSALHTGGAILQDLGLRGTYYTSFGLMGKTAPTGEIFVAEDIECLVAAGHELACHTFSHCDSWGTAPSTFKRSVIENAITLDHLRPGARFRTFSYPISPPRPGTKRAVSQHFTCCRGGGQAINTGIADLNYLSAYFMEQSRASPGAIMSIIDRNREARGWLIFANHDISDAPTPFGCTPRLFADVVQHAVNSGARILPVGEALDVLRGHAPRAT